MATYTDLHMRRKENLTILRLPGDPDDGMTGQRVIFANPENIYYGQFVGGMSDCILSSVTLIDSKLSINGYDIALSALPSGITKALFELSALSCYAMDIDDRLDEIISGDGPYVSIFGNNGLINAISGSLGFTDYTDNTGVEHHSGNFMQIDHDGMTISAVSSSQFILSSNDSVLSIADTSVAVPFANVIDDSSKDSLNNILTSIQSNVSNVYSMIPEAASPANMLADKQFVIDNTGEFDGTYANWQAVPDVSSGYQKIPTIRDYIIVLDAKDYRDEYAGTWRFKYSADDWEASGKAGWKPEYNINPVPFTEQQMSAIDSGIDADKVAQIEASKIDIEALSAFVPEGTSAENKLVNTSYASSTYLPLVGGTVSGDFNIVNGHLSVASLDSILISGQTMAQYLETFRSSIIDSVLSTLADAIAPISSDPDSNSVAMMCQAFANMKTTIGEAILDLDPNADVETP